MGLNEVILSRVSINIRWIDTQDRGVMGPICAHKNKDRHLVCHISHAISIVRSEKAKTLA